MKIFVTFDYIDGTKSETKEMSLWDHKLYELIKQKFSEIHPTRRVDCITITKKIPLSFLSREISKC